MKKSEFLPNKVIASFCSRLIRLILKRVNFKEDFGWTLTVYPLISSFSVISVHVKSFLKYERKTRHGSLFVHFQRGM